MYSSLGFAQRRSMGYRRPGRATILPPPKVVRFLMPPYHPIFPSNVNVNVNVNREIFNVAKIA